ncbi:Methyltransferase type 11 [Roseiflexus castenholzii DSM 13941]|jgi:ubiquinone/menaquinone biosynthesis C-methylase UbiE|uniref:Methyltransferase type 11 n=2 Tax=Roseiflexus castenholzii TaxID=120962 RepID=A7NRA1_ROSCS|nr:Methyltransferase type 11 [Roseiflexus castenholzii DSM 13941]
MKGMAGMVTAETTVEQAPARPKPVSLPAWRCVLYEVALNGLRILWETVNDFSLWRLIEYPWATRALGIARGDTVVDIGSGTSSFPHMLAKEGVNVVIVEIEHRRVRWQRDKRRATARPGDGELLPIVADATRLPFRSGSVPSISAISSLEHIPDDAAVGREIGRVLAPGGIVALTLPFTGSERTSFFAGIRPFKQVARNAFVQEGKPGSFFRFYTDDDIRQTYIEPANAEVVERRAFGRSILNGRYHETRLTRFWRRIVLKDLLLAWLIHPLEERFDRSDPLYVMLALRKRREEP